MQLGVCPSSHQRDVNGSVVCNCLEVSLKKEAVRFSSLFLLSYYVEHGCNGLSCNSHLDHKLILRMKIMHQDGGRKMSSWVWDGTVACHPNPGLLHSRLLMCKRHTFFLFAKNVSHSFGFLLYVAEPSPNGYECYLFLAGKLISSLEQEPKMDLYCT